MFLYISISIKINIEKFLTFFILEFLKMSDSLNLSDQEKIQKSCVPGAFLKNNIIFSKPVTKDSLEGSCNFKFRDTDIVLATYPKSGITHF